MPRFWQPREKALKTFLTHNAVRTTHYIIKMPQLERSYTVPLRREWLKAPRYKRAKKAVIALKQFLQKHMKTEDVRLGRKLNLELWKQGIRAPPPRVKVNVVKTEEGVAYAELFPHKYELNLKEPEKKGVAKVVEKIIGKKEEKPAAEKVEEKKPTADEKKPEAAEGKHAHEKPEEHAKEVALKKQLEKKMKGRQPKSKAFPEEQMKAPKGQ